MINTTLVTRIVGASALAVIALGTAFAIGSASQQQGGGTTGGTGTSTGKKLDDWSKSTQKEIQKATDKVKEAMGEGQPPLPPGWTPEDMQACMEAGTPGPMHARLAKQAGTWTGKSTMWMAPGTEPMTSEMVSKVTVEMDGRFVRAEMSGNSPAMGPFMGLGYSGFDNVSQKFVGNWLDNHSTGIMNGVGELASDGSTINWNYTYNCPVTKKQAVMRQVESYPNPDTMVLDMFCVDPKTAKEFKCMHIEFTRQKAATR